VAWQPRQLVDRLGGHPARSLEIDLESDSGLGSWLIAACLCAARVDEAVALRAHGALRAANCATAVDLAETDPARIASALATVDYPKPEVAAVRLARVCGALVERWDGSISALAAEALDLTEIGTRLTRLAPGLGPATALDFLRPLRDRFSAACETPLSPQALAAAEHLGWIQPGEDSEGEPGALRAALADDPDAPALMDVEAALDRLGRRSCRRDRTARCPLGEECPRRGEGVAAPAPRE